MARELISVGQGAPFNQVKLTEDFPLEEIIHFNRNPNRSNLRVTNRDPVVPLPTHLNPILKNRDSSSSSPSSAAHHDDSYSSPIVTNPHRSSRHDDHEWESDSNESQIEVFNRAENYDSDNEDEEDSSETGTTGTRSQSQSRLGRGRVSTLLEQKEEKGLSEENLPSSSTSFNDPFVLDVKRADVILDAFVFCTILGEFLTDFVIAIWHYRDGMSWGAGITWILIICGAGSILHQFNYLDQEQIKRLFDKGKRIRILVNCFPPLATIISSFQCAKVGYAASKNSMLSGQYLAIENFSKNLSKTQSFFQAAPQATLQLLLFVEALDAGSIGLFKGFFSMTNILLSLTVMTNASLPSKAENFEQLKKMGQSPSSRIFIGIRMFSSFASRSMAVTSLLVGCRCLLGPKYAFSATIVSISIVLVPRIIFTFIDFTHQFIVGRRAHDGRTTSGSACYEVLLGYLATILFPVGHPLWVFWYTWIETAIFVLAGNVIGWSRSCVVNVVNSVYTAVFIILFTIVPVLIPYLKDYFKDRHRRNVQAFLDGRNRIDVEAEAEDSNGAAV